MTLPLYFLAGYLCFVGQSCGWVEQAGFFLQSKDCEIYGQNWLDLEKDRPSQVSELHNYRCEQRNYVPEK